MMPCIPVSYLIIGHPSKINRILKWSFNQYLSLCILASLLKVQREEALHNEYLTFESSRSLRIRSQTGIGSFTSLSILQTLMAANFTSRNPSVDSLIRITLHRSIVFWISSTRTGTVLRIFMSDVFLPRIPFLGGIPYWGFSIITRSFEPISAHT